MIATRFRSVYWVGGVAVAALSCYLVSQRVASERATLARVESQILEGRRDIRSLQTEIGTRAGLNQIERWNADVISLTAPKPAQYLANEVQLASLVRPVEPAMDAPSAVVQVAAPAPEPAEALPQITRASYQPAPANVADEAPRAAPAPKRKDEAKPAAVKEARRSDKTDKAEKIVAKAKSEPKKAEAARRARPDADGAPRLRMVKADAAETPRLRSAVFVKPGRDHQNIALLDDKLLGDITKIAARERGANKRER